MSHVIRLLVAPPRLPSRGGPLPKAGDYLHRWDFDYKGGWGAAWWTPNLAEAHHFPSAKEALRIYVTQSTLMPLRPWDGQPNRPLALYTVEILSVENLEADLARREQARSN